MLTLFNSRFYRSMAYGLSLSLVNAMAPTGLDLLFSKHGPGLKLPAARKLMPESHPLSLKEMKKAIGKDTISPYLGGSSKWDLNYKGIDLCTGNYSTSMTDLDFQGGYGIPVSVQRTYSANNLDEGPFGPGWTLSADVRTSAGGLLKKSRAPVMAVPAAFKEMADHSSPQNANVAAGVVATDASGFAEVVQKDVDGVLTTPAYDNNVSNATYTYQTWLGALYQIQTGNTTTTADGTVYTYGNYGTYPSGMTPTGGGATIPSNVLKVSSVEDRQGNITTYTYSGPSNLAQFKKASGDITSEQELVSVLMPNGHQLTFTWEQLFNTADNLTHYRVHTVSDNGGRTVTYNYSNVLPGEPLISVTSPGGKTTTYGWGTAQVLGGGVTANNDLLITSITDPRGLTTNIVYQQDWINIGPYEAPLEGYLVNLITAPNGNITFPVYPGASICYIGWTYNNGSPLAPCVYEAGPNNGVIYQEMRFNWSSLVNGNTVTYILGESMEPPVKEGQAYPIWQANMTGGSGQLMEAPYTVTKVYDPNTQQCLQTNSTYGRDWAGQWTNDLLSGGTLSDGLIFWGDQGNITVNDVYNFQSNPLSEETIQNMTVANTGAIETQYPQVDNHTYYAYWGQNKYFQQKAVIDRIGYSNGTQSLPSGRVSYTDYVAGNPASPYPAPAGVGQAVYTYNSEFTTFANGYNPNNPSYDWQDNIAPTMPGSHYSSNCVYDSFGRCTDVYKLQSSSPSYAYVHTVTAYGPSNSTWWGEPQSVTEDAGGIGRVTQTLAYDSSGHATQTEDAAGHIFNTTYANNDYQVSSIAETDSSQNKTLVSYTYGTGADNGQVMSVTDGLSGVVDSFAYDDNPGAGDGGIGQPSSVVESWSGGGGYTVGYTYTLNGERANVTYATGYGTNRWQYADYTTVGGPSEPSRVPQTLRQLDSNGNPTPEEFHYLYDPSGRLLGAGFAMTPQPGYTPPAGQPYYNVNQTPWYRAHAVYDNAAGGQLMNLWYTYENQVNSLWVATSLTGFSYSYDPVTLQKTGATFLSPGSGGTGWVTGHTESYGYDATLDYLTSANYGDGLSNPTDSWTYDAAGNRLTDADNSGTWSYDNLNRMTASPGQTYSNDILGNRLSNSSSTYGWDHLNRMTSFQSGSNPAWNYTYRADGMRTLKSNGTASTSYAYDAQMGIEDVDFSGTSVSAVTDYALGSRGIERFAKTTGGSTNVMYPLYDGHGNMVSSLSLSGVSFSTGTDRAFDAWGSIRGGSSSGDPKGRYCASLGHKQDDESGLIYMRARYYDPASGRFASQDPSHQGGNWFIYVNNSPLSHMDQDGKSTVSEWWAALWGVLCFISSAFVYIGLKGVENCFAEYGGWELAGVLWAVTAGAALVLAMWAGADMARNLINAWNEASYGAGLAGHGDEVFALDEAAKSSRLLAPIAYDNELFALLGEIDSGD